LPYKNSIIPKEFISKIFQAPGRAIIFYLGAGFIYFEAILNMRS